MSGARVLVTGATGFLGGYVLRDLRDHGFEVFAAGRNASRLGDLVDEVHRVPGDLASLRSRELPVDAVIHCAALSTPWGRWSEFRQANVDGAAHVAEFARRNGARRVVHVSSPSIYAAARDRTDIRERDVNTGNRLNGYIRSKILAEQLLQSARRRDEIRELVIVRPRGLIGVGDPSLVPRLLDVHARFGVPLFDGGQNLIDVTAVENVASALRLALTAGDPNGGVYNVTNGEPRPFRDLLERLLALAGAQPRFRVANRRAAWAAAASLEAVCRILPGRPEPALTRYTLSTIAYSQTLDISRARRDLGYVPTVTLDDALAAVAADLRSAA
ncbi:NAD-dependent epimerase/dehydratase family protein [Microbacterium hydrocarbonoxydans]|uniref:NAD-dependent epimerase/dehydratase family protein n=1 Tax=Microbacterium hydrocarbonoxydans TaxID=273678 RepID=UPI00203C94AA|nr:NAD-dependent epimerase/dehydratase family protein [Microbacterium hydrocarbonoxydans]MCM3780453.1 NAD-dependent epimerase/dehydratase family protein [Microbacterium hydrocarbonoxydans]